MSSARQVDSGGLTISQPNTANTAIFPLASFLLSIRSLTNLCYGVNGRIAVPGRVDCDPAINRSRWILSHDTGLKFENVRETKNRETDLAIIATAKAEIR